MFAVAKLLHDSDASKVMSKGVGLQKAFVNKEATFTVDASHAGMFNKAFLFNSVFEINVLLGH